MKTRFLQLNLALVFCCLFYLNLSAQQTEPGIQGNTLLSGLSLDEIFRDSPEVYFTFQLSDKAKLNSISKLISIDKVENGKVHAFATRKTFPGFLAMGIPYIILPQPAAEFLDEALSDIDLSQPLAWDFYPAYTAYETMMYAFETSYPALCRIQNIGTLSSGRKLLIAKLSSNVDSAMNKPQFLYVSSMHGNELTGYVLMLRLIDHLLVNYGTDPRLTQVLNSIELHICPLANPDGTFYGGNSTVNQAIRGNANEVDLNRNFPDPQDGPHPDGNAWQEETVAFMAFAEDQHFVSAANFHGGAEVFNYPWDTWATLPADDNWWYYVGRQFADTVHVYSPASYFNDLDNGVTNGFAWYELDGGRQDYMNWFHQCREVTIEISNTKKPPASQLPTFWNYLYPSLLNYIEQCLYGIRGIVTDSLTGDPLAAKVFIQGHDFDSSFVYSALPVGNYHRLLYPGTYDLTFTCPGYYPKTVSNQAVSYYNTTVKDVQLVPLTVSITAPTLSRLQIYPNPSRGSFTLYWPDSKPIQRLRVRNLLGEVVWEQENSLPVGNQVHIDVSRCDAGLYLLELSSDKQQQYSASLVVY